MSPNTNSTIAPDPREQRGLQIATTQKLRRDGDKWLVPSQSRRGTYTVIPDGEGYRCSCPDYGLRRRTCKHIHAVEYSIRSESQPEGTTTVTKTVRVTYRQDWPKYNAAQTQEKATFQVLLADLCRGVSEPEQAKGRPRLALAEMVFAAAFKVYSTFSGRRFMTDLREAHAKGHITKVPYYNSIFNYLEMDAFTPLLRQMITVSSLPLKAVETDFAVDGSGFSTCRFVQWFNARYGHEQDNHDWIKAHLMCGVKTNVVTSVEISGRHAHDAPFWPALVEATAKNFPLGDVLGDKGYSSKDNHEVAERLGGTPFIPFKYDAVRGDADSAWVRMWHFYNFRRDEFLAHYHKRSNVESTFNMIKAKFGSALRSKTDTALVNELLCKVLCHNICCVIQSMHELGITPEFGAAGAASG
jgi:transposase